MAHIHGIKYNRRELCSIMATVCYSSIDYWCEITEIEYAGIDDGSEGIEWPKRIVIKPHQNIETGGAWGVFVDDRERDKRPITITINDLQKAINQIVGKKVRVSDDIRRWIASGDPGMIDADAADVIVQVACFGEIVFG